MDRIAVYVLLLVFCIVFSAFFSMVEAAFLSLEKFRLQYMIETNVRGASRVARIMEKPERFLSTILLGNNLVCTAAAAIATSLAFEVRGGDVSVIIATLLVTFVLLVFCDIGPKTFGNSRYREKITVICVRPVEIISFIFAPFVAILSWGVMATARLAGGRNMYKHLIRPEDIESMINVGHKEGTVEKNEALLLHNVFDFGDRPAREVLVPRTEMVAVQKGTLLSEFLQLYSKAPMSRYPVYEESLDSVIGILSIKDVIMSMARGSITLESSIDEIVRPAFFAPESKLISDLFHEMRDNNYHMSIIVDEYGGTAGLVSLSRLMEEIFGPVGNELSAASKEFESINEHTFHVDGGMRIDDVNAEIGLGLPEGEYETVAGFVLNLLGRIPKRGQVIKYQEIKIVVTKMKGLKIEEVLVTREKPKQDESPKGPL